MADQVSCPRCRHANPPENRFCGSCGAALRAGSDLVERRGSSPTFMGHALPVKPGPVGKALAVGLGTLAVRAGLSWLRHRTTTENRPSPSAARKPDTAAFERLLWQRLEEILIQESWAEHGSRVSARRSTRSVVIAEIVDRQS